MRLCGIVGGIFACTGEFGNARGISAITSINSGYILCVKGGALNKYQQNTQTLCWTGENLL